MDKNNLKLTVTQFANSIGRTYSYVQQYIKRGKLVKSGKYIDLDDPVNQKFVEKWQSKGGVFDITRANEKPVSKGKASNNSTKEGGSDNTPSDAPDSDLNRQKKIAEIHHTQAITEKERLKYAKMDSQLIGKEETERLAEHTVKVFSENYQEYIDQIVDKLCEAGGGNKEEIRENIQNHLQNITKETHKDLMNGIHNLSEQYRETRGRGEKK
jgi:hypothetical protein